MFDNDHTYKNLVFLKAEKKHLESCSQILENTKLGRLYFLDGNGQYIGHSLLLEGFQNDDIYVSYDKEHPSDIIGFSWIQKRGIFNWFPF